MELTYIRILGIVLVAALVAAGIAPVATMAASTYEAASAEDIREDGRPNPFRNITYGVLLTAFYDIRNETTPMLQWAEARNVTFARYIAARAEFHYNMSLQYNTSGDERLAKIHLFIATMIYAKTPIVSYVVLGRTVRSNLGENGTVTNETVVAVLGVAAELKEIVLGARGYALSRNITVPPLVDMFIARAEWRLNVSERLLENGSYRLALREAVIGYRLLVRAYALVIYATIIDDVFMGNKLYLRNVIAAVYPKATDTLKRILPLLPVTLRERIVTALKTGLPPTEALKIIRNYIDKVHERLENMSDERLARIITFKLLRAIQDTKLWRRFASKLGVWPPRNFHEVYNITYHIVLNIVKSLRNNTASIEDLVQAVIQEIRAYLLSLGFTPEEVHEVITTLARLIIIVPHHHIHH